MSTANTICRLEPHVTVALFAFALLVPSLDTVFDIDPTPPPLLNRHLAAPPPLPHSMTGLREFPELAEAWINDRFGFRDFLIRFHNRVSVFLLRTSPTDNIRMGPNGWLFLAGGIFGQEGRALDDFRGLYPFSSDDLDLWERTLEERRAALAAQGIRYLVVFVPNKASVYPEELPMGLGRHRGRTRLDQLIERLQARRFPVVDLRPALRAARPNGRSYEITGTHWNRRGGFVGDAAIARVLARWFPKVELLDPSGFREAVKPGRPMELAKMLGLADDMTEDRVTLEPEGGFASKRVPAAFDPPRKLYRPPFAMERDAPELPRAVVFHDSFFAAIAPFLAEHFSRTAFYWQYDLSQAAVRAERPDVVIQLMGERVLLPEIAQ